MTKDEALKLALDALETSMYPQQKQLQAITAIKEALAEQDSKDKEQAKTDSFVRQLDEALAQQEPWEKFCDSNCVWTDHHPDCKLAQRKPLTEEEIKAIEDGIWKPEFFDDTERQANCEFARAIEAAHNIKGEA